MSPVYLDGTGDDGKLGRLHAGPHVEDHVLVPDAGEVILYRI